jgi:hypothetical protein
MTCCGKCQRGGAFRVNGFVALALLAVAVAGSFYGYYQHTHRIIELNFTLPTHLPAHPAAKDDYGVTHVFPPERNVCDSFNTICWTRI